MGTTAFFIISNMWGIASLVMPTKGRASFCTVMALLFFILSAVA